MKTSTLNELEIDALQEIGNVSIGNAATALSKQLEQHITIDLTKASCDTAEELAKLIRGTADRPLLHLTTRFTGDIDGFCTFLFPQDEAARLINLLINKPRTTKTAKAPEAKAFTEMATSFTNTYLEAMGRMLDVTLNSTTTATAKQTTAKDLIATLPAIKQKRFSIRTRIAIEEQSINGFFLLFLEQPSLQKTLTAIHDKFGV